MADKCPDCGDMVPAEAVDRRDFLRGAAALAGMAALPAFAQDKPDRTAEELIKELHAGLSDDQKKDVVMPFESDARLKIYNAALGKTIGQAYTKPQQELVQRILRSIASDDKGWHMMTRGGTWDASKAFENCGANIFGDPSKGKFTWVFSGHHLTIRCDGDTVEGPAFGGPLYYGHTPNGYSDNNVFNHQTYTALEVFDSLSEAQRKQAIIVGTPGEGAESIKFRAAGQAMPGIAAAELSAEQKGLVEKTMRDLLAPYRKADGDEVMRTIKANGGLEKLHMAFYKEDAEKEIKRRSWHFWRLEGPGFVWNYRVLPHVHTFVNISSKV
ncbi:MAG TPA: DUF3500 domain-containing protein [Planctomycetota bacterium]